MDVVSHNRTAWDQHVNNGCEWTVPATPEQIAGARRGVWQIGLTAGKPAPRAWFPADLRGVEILCLASGGGQQGPLLAAMGALVTVFDNSPSQLAQDRLVAEREGLSIRTVQGDMADLSAFAAESFDLIVHPVSNNYVTDVLPVWRECYRVLRPGGILVAGFTQPHIYCFEESEAGFRLRYPLPFSDLTSISAEERAARFSANVALEFSHTFAAQLGGQLAAGFHLVDLYEDSDPRDSICQFMPEYMATRALKPNLK